MISRTDFIRSVIVFFLGVQLFLGFYLKLLNYPGREIFPFFSWDLFSVVPFNPKMYSIRITEVNSEPLREPAIFKNPVGRSGHAAMFYYIVQEFARAVNRKDELKTARYKSLIENNYLNIGNSQRVTGYQLIQSEFSTLDSYKRETEYFSVIKEFSSSHE